MQPPSETERSFHLFKQQNVMLPVFIFMSIKSYLEAESNKAGRYAVVAPQRSDVISGALRQAFSTPRDACDFSTLLAGIDQAEQCRGRA